MTAEATVGPLCFSLGLAENFRKGEENLQVLLCLSFEWDFFLGRYLLRCLYQANEPISQWCESHVTVFSYPKALANKWKCLKNTFSKGRCRMKNWPLEVFFGKSLQILVKQCLSKVSGGQFPNSAISHTCFRNLPNNFRHSLHPFVANSFKGNFNSHIALGVQITCVCLQKKPEHHTSLNRSWNFVSLFLHFHQKPPKSKTQNPTD